MKLPANILRNVALKDYVYYGIGGPADYFALSSRAQDFPDFFNFAQDQKLPVTILGNGTNLLVRDKGIRGLVIYYGSEIPAPIEVLSESTDGVRLRAPAFMAKSQLLDYALENDLAGLEFSAGIPGTLGGAVHMNAGTKWGSYSEVIQDVHFYSPRAGFFSKPKAEMGFKYRGHGEIFKTGESSLITAVDFYLPKNKSATEIRDLVDEILKYRGARQPLELPNCGSVFKNPPNTALGAGRLIEACGLKGTQIGQAQISLKHANFILNLGGARAQDVESLIRLIQKTVLNEKGVELETEVIILGEA